MNVKKTKIDETAGPDAGTLDILPDGEAQATEAEKVASMIYLGPNLPGGRLLQSTVFRGGIPVYLQPLIVEQPDVAALIVPVDEISAAQARIVQTGTPEYGAYQAILKGGQVDGV